MVNVVICGTPGTGKSSLIEKVKTELTSDGFSFINVSEFAKENDCIAEYDEELETSVLDEEKLSEILEKKLKGSEQHYVIECIHGDLVPRELIDLAIVCRTDNKKLYDRLVARKYNEKKVSNNIEAEIFQTILDEARGSFKEEAILELANNEPEDLERNARTLIDKLRAKKLDS